MESTQILLLVGAFVLGAIVAFAFMKATTSSTPIFTTPTMHDFTIRGMINNYRSQQLNFINNNLPVEDAHSVWHSLSEIKNFVNSVEIESCKVNGSLSDSDLGVRFYYAAYPRAEEFEKYGIYGVPETYALRHTMIMIPTIKKNTNDGVLHFDFNPLDSTTYDRTTSVNESPNFKTMAMTTMGEGTNGTQLADNHGNIIPPISNVGENY